MSNSNLGECHSVQKATNYIIGHQYQCNVHTTLPAHSSLLRSQCWSTTLVQRSNNVAFNIIVWSRMLIQVCYIVVATLPQRRQNDEVLFKVL